MVSTMNLLRRSRGSTAIVQLSPTQAAVFSSRLSSAQVISVPSELEGVDVWESRVLLWGSEGAGVYEINSPGGIEHVASIMATEGASMAIHHDSIFQTEDGSVKVLDCRGTVRQTLRLDDSYGKALCLDVSREFLVLATTNCSMHMWRIDSDEIKSYGPSSGRRVPIEGGKGEVTSIRCNSDCSKVSFQVKCGSDTGVSFLIFVYDTIIDRFFSYNFSIHIQDWVFTIKGQDFIFGTVGGHERQRRGPHTLACSVVRKHFFRCAHFFYSKKKNLLKASVSVFHNRALQRMPISHCWDDGEPRLLACVTNPWEQLEGATLLPAKNPGDFQITSFFATSDDGILMLEQIDIESKVGLLGMDVPGLRLFSIKQTKNDALSVVIENRTMRDFSGLEHVETKAKAALLDFNYNLILGNLDGAYKAVQDIKDNKIWHAIACICVKTKRVEVALHCFAIMGDASAAAFVRNAFNEPEEDTRIAAVAIQLGLVDEARKLYIGCKRFDLLNKLYETCGEWDKAIEVASKYDRVHLKGTLHAYAKHLESIKSFKDAIHHYELSGSQRCEVPRMLYSAQQIKELQDYVDKSGDSSLQRWWAHFCESNDLLPQAIEYYTAAGDISSLVRVYCFQNEFPTAANLVMESSDTAAAFSLARQYEKTGNIRQAIKFFSKAGKPTYGARLAMKHNIDNELLALALQSTKEMMTQAAKYYEDKSKYEEAVLLYHKGGHLEKAINVCFCTQLFDALKAIAEDLSEEADPGLLAKCGDFLLHHNQIDKAVQLFISAKQYHTALDLCLSEGILLTDKMAEGIKCEDQKSEESTRLLYKVAELFNAQGSYHLACKKFTQAGDRVSAMKALLKSGDTERIIFFANVSRQKQIYVLAANYLQTLDWHHDGNIMKTIIQMYNKAGEMESLASFYEACAQIEIDEFRDYEKALAAMTEASKYLTKTKDPDKDEKVQSLRSRIAEVERFVQIRWMVKSDPTGMVRACSELLLELSCSGTNSQVQSVVARFQQLQNCRFLSACVRTGDLYALLIEFYHSQGSMEQAYQVIEKMRARKIALGPYIDPAVTRAIYLEMGMERNEDLEDVIGEEINVMSM